MTVRSKMYAICVIVFAQCFASCLPERSAKFSTQYSADSHIARGMEYYSEYCIRCHGDGAGDHIHPALTITPKLGSPTALARVILHGQAGLHSPQSLMPAMPEIPDEEISALIVYLGATFGGYNYEYSDVLEIVGDVRTESR